MAEYFDLPDRYPELFAQLPADQRQDAINVLASSWLEGRKHTREEVARFIDMKLGRISGEEYRKLILEEVLALQEAKAKEQ